MGFYSASSLYYTNSFVDFYYMRIKVLFLRELLYQINLHIFGHDNYSALIINKLTIVWTNIVET